MALACWGFSPFCPTSWENRGGPGGEQPLAQAACGWSRTVTGGWGGGGPEERRTWSREEVFPGVKSYSKERLTKGQISASLSLISRKTRMRLFQGERRVVLQ